MSPFSAPLRRLPFLRRHHPDSVRQQERVEVVALAGPYVEVALEGRLQRLGERAAEHGAERAAECFERVVALRLFRVPRIGTVTMLVTGLTVTGSPCAPAACLA